MPTLEGFELLAKAIQV